MIPHPLRAAGAAAGAAAALVSLVLCGPMPPALQPFVTRAEPGSAAPIPAPSPEAVLPVPTRPIALGLGEPMSFEDLLTAFAGSTGLTIVVDSEARQPLSKLHVRTFGGVELPPAEVYPVVESMLAAEGFALVELGTGAAPQVLRLVAPGGFVRQGRYVEPEDLEAWADHPAVLVTTCLHLDALDSRHATNSLRSLLTNTNTQMVVSVGNAGSLVLTGTGRSVAQIARFLRETDARERERLEARAAVPDAEAPDPDGD